MGLSKKVLMVVAISVASALLMGCDPLLSLVSDIPEQRALEANHKKNEALADEERKQCNIKHSAYYNFPKEQKTLLWKYSGIKRPIDEGKYIQVPYHSFICTTQEDLNHAIDILSSGSGRYSTQYLDMYRRQVMGTSCVMYNYPNNVIGYVLDSSKYRKISETKVMWKQEGSPIYPISVGWVSEIIDPTIIDFQIIEDRDTLKRLNYRRSNNLPNAMPDKYKDLDC